LIVQYAKQEPTRNLNYLETQRRIKQQSMKMVKTSENMSTFVGLEILEAEGMKNKPKEKLSC
jgi:hypothetical protein